MANYDYNHLSGEYLCEQRRKYPVKNTVSPKDAALNDIMQTIARQDGSLSQTLALISTKKYNSEFERNKLLSLYNNYYSLLSDEIYGFLGSHTNADVIFMPPEAEVMPEGFDRPVSVSPTLILRWNETENDGSITPHRQAVTIKTQTIMKNELTNYVQLEYLKTVLDENVTPTSEELSRIGAEDRRGIINPIEYHSQYWTIKDTKNNVSIAKSREDKNVDYKAEAEKFSNQGFVISKSTCATCSCNAICNFAMPLEHNDEEVQTKQSLTGAMTSDAQDNIISRFREGIGKCVAVPGGGKTFVLSAYIATLIIEGVDPTKIWAGTFTNLAAKELRERVRQYLDEYGLADEADKLYMGTFHGFCEELIAEQYQDVGYDEPPTVADGIEEAATTKEILATNFIPGLDYTSFYTPYAEYNGVLTTLTKFKNFKKDGNSLKLSDQELNAYYKYQNLKEAKNMLDFDDVIEFTNKLTMIKPEIWEEMGYEYILVDEFQDTNSAQVEILKKLMNNSHWKATLVVGDEDQSIYSFQGADVRLFDNIHSLLDPNNEKNHYDFPLNDNYRSTTPIADVANQIRRIYPSATGNNKEVKCLRDGESVVNQYFKDDAGEIEYIAEHVAAEVEKGNDDIAVIARNSAYLNKIGEALSKRGISAIKIGSDAYVNNPRVQVAFVLAQIVNHSENPSRLDVAIFANACLDGELRNMSDEEREASIDEFYDIITSLDPQEKYDNFKELIKGLKSDECLEDFLERCYKKKTWEDVYRYIKDFKTYGQKETFRNPTKHKGVNLVTAHSSKGLEWDTVFGSMTGFDSKWGTFGKEDARLMFVMATRAKNKLFMTGNGFVKKGSELVKSVGISHYASVTHTTDQLNEALGITILQKGEGIQMTNQRKRPVFNLKTKDAAEVTDQTTKAKEQTPETKTEEVNTTPKRRGRPRKNPVVPQTETPVINTETPEL